MKKRYSGILALAALMSVSVAHAGRDDDSREVRQLVQEGKVIPLEQLLARHRGRLQGRVLDLEMERERDRVVYEIKTLDEQGVVHKAKIDAESGEWIELPSKDRKRDDVRKAHHERDRDAMKPQLENDKQSGEPEAN